MVAALRRQRDVHGARRLYAAVNGDLPFEFISGRALGGELHAVITAAHTGPIHALAVVEHRGAPLIVSAGEDGCIVWRRLTADP